MNNSKNVLLFQKQLLAVNGEFISLDENQKVSSLVKEFITSNSIKSIVLSDFSQHQDLVEALEEDTEILADFGSRSYPLDEAGNLCAKADAGITDVYAIIADTGTLVISSRNRGDRLCSSLPPIHLALIGNSKVYLNFEEFIENTPKEHTYALITGPSRTADIEKKLILGAHGPKRVVVFYSEGNAGCT
ncbi:MAG: lactate utilization protein [Calditrichaeota bacterium]|nr:lactate utilization protein [Calditrichota bacterium]MBT7617438.1 lactate utilization protein [Calditrichota bacterium]